MSVSLSVGDYLVVHMAREFHTRVCVCVCIYIGVCVPVYCPYVAV